MLKVLLVLGFFIVAGNANADVLSDETAKKDLLQITITKFPEIEFEEESFKMLPYEEAPEGGQYKKIAVVGYAKSNSMIKSAGEEIELQEGDEVTINAVASRSSMAKFWKDAPSHGWNIESWYLEIK